MSRFSDYQNAHDVGSDPVNRVVTDFPNSKSALSPENAIMSKLFTPFHAGALSLGHRAA